MSYWLTGDPTFLNKVTRHRKEEMKGETEIKLVGLLLLQVQVVHPPRPALLIDTGLHPRLRLDIGGHGKAITATVGIRLWP